VALVVVILLAAVAAGFFLLRGPAPPVYAEPPPPSEAAATHAPAAAGTDTNAAGRRKTGSVLDELAGDELAGIQSVTRPETRPQPGPRPRRGAVTSAAELLQWINEIQSGDDRREAQTAFEDLGRQLGAEDIGNALTLVQGVSDDRARNALYRGIFLAYAERDPRAAVEAMEALQPESANLRSQQTAAAWRDYRTALIAVLDQWSHQDPGAAAAYTGEIPSRYRNHALVTVYTSWAEDDPARALASAGERNEAEQQFLLPAVFQGWAMRDPAAAADYARQIDDEKLAARVFESIARGFTEGWNKSPGEAAAWAAQGLPPEVASRALPALYRRWAATDPSAAAAHALGLDAGRIDDRMSLIGSVLTQWAQSDPDAAINWVDGTFADDEDYVAAVEAITRVLRYRNPEQTAVLLERVPFSFADGTAGAREVSRLMAAWIRKDPDAAKAWVRSVDDVALQIIATKSLAASLASRSYSEARQWAAGLENPDMQAYALSNIALRQSLQNMKVSDAWINELPAGFIRARTAASYALGSLWRAKDNDTAAIIKAQLERDALDMASIRAAVNASKLDDATKIKLSNMLE